MTADRLSYIGYRLIQMVPILLGLTILVFLLIHLIPGDPARAMLGPRAPNAAVIRLDHQWGLDEPVPLQFGHFLNRLAHGNLGTSLTYDEPVTQMISDRLAPTLWLIGYAAVLTVILTIPLAVLAATHPGRLPDHVVRLVPLLGLGMPSFWVGILLILGLAIKTGWFPVGGFGDGFLGHVQAMFIPGLTVALAIVPFTIRSLRTALIEVLNSDYIVTARAKGLPERRVLSAHAVRNALIPAITVLGINIGWMVGNTLVVEKIFALNGLGALMIDSILNRDFPVVQGITLVFGILVVLVNLTTDVVRSLFDPRLKLGR
jgi:peptide/nickel transport system permease protein